mmetsp:Transcript_61582/g.174915  ORF Transcript_61582/g.174915 Transcript_61582/m.174915 type:complete len:210 (+) Transcript_61582:1982-2611(+)
MEAAAARSAAARSLAPTAPRDPCCASAAPRFGAYSTCSGRPAPEHGAGAPLPCEGAASLSSPVTCSVAAAEAASPLPRSAKGLATAGEGLPAATGSGGWPLEAASESPELAAGIPRAFPRASTPRGSSAALPVRRSGGLKLKLTSGALHRCGASSWAVPVRTGPGQSSLTADPFMAQSISEAAPAAVSALSKPEAFKVCAPSIWPMQHT